MSVSNSRRAPRRRKTVQKVQPGLRGFADTKKPHIDLIRDVQQHVVAEATKNAGAGRENHKIHVSEVIKDSSCARHLYYKITKELPTDNPPPAFHRLEVIWAAGHDAHHKWQNWIREMGDLYGSWHCLQCEYDWEDTSPPACVKCGGVLLRYDEVNLEIPSLYLVGHADGAMPSREALVEVKSFSVGSVRYENPKLVAEHTHKIDGKQVIDHEGVWNDIKRPLKSHLVQGLTYLWMCKNSGDPQLTRYQRIIFIYENKTTQATKTFEVKLSERHLTEHIETLALVVRSAENGVPPRRPGAFAPDAKPCNACVFRTKCWGETSGDSETTGAAVPAGRPSPGGEAEGGVAAVHPAETTAGDDPRGPRRHHGPGRSRPDRDDDSTDQVGRAPRRAGGDGRGRRAMGRRVEGEGTRTGFARRNRQGRDAAEG